MATVRAASSERPNESSKAESVVHLIKRPPVLQSRAANRTSRIGETLKRSRTLAPLLALICCAAFSFSRSAFVIMLYAEKKPGEAHRALHRLFQSFFKLSCQDNF